MFYDMQKMIEGSFWLFGSCIDEFVKQLINSYIKIVLNKILLIISIKMGMLILT